MSSDKIAHPMIHAFLVIALLWFIPATHSLAQDGSESFDENCRSNFENDGIIDLNAKNLVLIKASKLSFNFNKKMLNGEKVSLCQEAGTLTANKLTYNLDTQVISLTDQVRLNLDRFSLEGQSGTLDTETKKVRVEQAKYTLNNKDIIFSGAAKSASYQLDELIAFDAWITSCDPENPDWSIKAQRLTISKDARWGQVRHARLKLKKTPVFYLPWWFFPLTPDRKSGFLIPELGIEDGGLKFSVPYYLNLAAHYDATVTPTLLTARGLLLEGEFRHLSRNASNEITAGWIPQDKLFEEDQRAQKQTESGKRWYLRWEHDARWGKRLYSRINYGQASDNAYFEDFGKDVSDRNRRNLERHGSIGYQHAGWDFSLATQRFIRLDDTQERPYNLHSEVNLSHYAEYRKGWQLAIDVNMTDFRRNTRDLRGQDALTGKRVKLRSIVNYHLKVDRSSLRFRLGWQYNHYNIKNHDTQEYDRADVGAPLFSVESRLFAQRYGRKGDYIQTLEPRIYYLYSGASDSQRSLPIFDSGEYDLSFEQLFRDNSVVGGDRISDVNRLVLGLTSRFLKARSGQQLAELAVAGGVNFTKSRVSLDLNDSEQRNRLTPFIVRASLIPDPKLNFSFEWIRNFTQTRDEKLLARIQWRPSGRKVFNAGYRETYRYRQAEFSAHLPLSKKVFLAAAWRYDLDSRKDHVNLLGVEYKTCCWRIKTGINRTLEQENGSALSAKSENQFFISFELTGLGGNIDAVSNSIYRELIHGFSEE